MKNAGIMLLLSGIVAWSSGCDRGTVGGPNAPTAPDNKAPVVTSPNEGTFSLGTSNVHVTQGDTREEKITIHRGKNFDQDVKLHFTNLPTGVTIEPMDPTLKRGDTDVRITIRATNDAALGDHTITVSGQPTTGAAATNQFTVTVKKR